MGKAAVVAVSKAIGKRFTGELMEKTRKRADAESGGGVIILNFFWHSSSKSKDCADLLLESVEMIF